MAALNSYWYNAVLNRNGVCITRQGTMEAAYALKVIDTVKDENLDQPVMQIAVHKLEGDVVGECVLQENGGRRTYNPHSKSHTCERPVVKPYEFGTACHSKTYQTFNFEDTDDGKDSMQTQPWG